MLKITTIQESGRDVLLKLEGKITEQWAALLDGECRAYLRQYIDGRGVEVLNAFPHAHVTLMSAPALVTELLQIGGRS
jgi:hypothetical protein